MNRNVSLGQGVAILTLFLLMLWGVFWANGKALEPRGFSHLHHHPNGNLFILLGTRLFEHDPQDKPLAEYDLAALGITGKPGDFAFFANGDLLIRRGDPEHGFWHNFQRFLRLTNSKPTVSRSDIADLMRCKLPQGSCTPFTQIPLDLTDSHYLEIDRATERVFISDSTRHRLYMLSPKGAILATVGSGLIFPNRILFSQDRLYVANTNRHEITIYPVAEQGFGEPKHLPVLFREALAKGQVWPASVALIGDRLWVENADGGMRDGGVFLLRQEGGYEGKVNLPADADPFAMVEQNRRVLITDYSRDRIYEASTDGKLLGEFRSPAMQPVVDGIRETREFYRMVRWGFVGLFILAFGAGFAVALRAERKVAAMPPVSVQRDAGSPAQPRGEGSPGRMLSVGELEILRRDKRVVWMEPSRTVTTNLLIWMLGLGGSWIALTAFFFEIYWRPSMEVAPLRTMSLMIAPPLTLLVAAFKLWNMRHVRIGTYRDLVILVDHRKRAAVGRGNQIRYSRWLLAIGDVVVQLGGGAIKSFDDFMLATYLYPKLATATPLTFAQALMLPYRSYFPSRRGR